MAISSRKNNSEKSDAQRSLEELAQKRDACQNERRDAGSSQESYQSQSQSQSQSQMDDETQHQTVHQVQSWTWVSGETQSPVVDRDQTQTGAETQSQVTDQSESKTVDQTLTQRVGETQNQTFHQMHSYVGDDTQSQTGDKTQSQASDRTRSKTTDLIQSTDQTDSQTTNPNHDRMSSKDHHLDEKHASQTKESDVVNIEGSSDSTYATAQTRPGQIKGLLLGEKSKERDRDHGERSSYSPGEEQEIRTDESLGLMMSTENLNETDIVIAVMGPTGSGKSTFVRSASGCETGVGDDLKSFTSDVHAIRFRDQKSGQFVVLVDTPGFDDTYKSDLDILNMISNWLILSYKKGKLLSGILYLHRITDNRVAGTSLKNLRVFRELCGDDALKKVYFTTTMWDEVATDVGKKRLGELESVYWAAMIHNGAQVFSCDHLGSEQELVRRIVKDEDRRKLQLQEEMVELQMEIKETAAGRELYSRLEVIVQKQTELIRRIHEVRAGVKDPQLVLELEEQLAGLRKQMDERLCDMEKLKLPRMKRFFAKLRDTTKTIRSMLFKHFYS